MPEPMNDEERLQEAINCFNDVVELVHQLVEQLQEKETRIDELEQELELMRAENEEYYEKEYAQEIDELRITRRI